MSDPNREAPEGETQLDRIEKGLLELARLFEAHQVGDGIVADLLGKVLDAVLSDDSREVDQARGGWRAYRKRMGAK